MHVQTPPPMQKHVWSDQACESHMTDLLWLLALYSEEKVGKECWNKMQEEMKEFPRTPEI